MKVRRQKSQNPDEGVKGTDGRQVILVNLIYISFVTNSPSPPTILSMMKGGIHFCRKEEEGRDKRKKVNDS